MDDVEIRVELENHKGRITVLEKQVEQLSAMATAIQGLSLSVNKLATNMENMVTEQKEQGERIKSLESIPAESWNNLRKSSITTIASTIAGALVIAIILLLAQQFM